MSASLVGSEMCIRDRRYTCRHYGCALSCCPIARATLRRCNSRHGRPAVSYTHLTLPTICSV
eukprot:6355403-Alexandrium_andersonii.AAC.1